MGESPLEPRKLPGAEKIAADLRRLAIERGPDAKMPSLSDLQEKYGVTHMTIRSAYQRLIQEGRVVAEPQRGYFVRGLGTPVLWRRTQSMDPAQVAALPLDGSGVPVDTWVYAAMQLGLSAHQEISVEIVTDAPIGRYHAAELLHLDAGEPIVVRRRTRFTGPEGGPAVRPESLADSYYSGALVDGTAIRLPATVNTAKILTDLGHPMVTHHEEVWPILADHVLRERLALADVTPLLEIIRISYDPDGNPVLVQHIRTTSPTSYELRRFE